MESYEHVIVPGMIFYRDGIIMTKFVTDTNGITGDRDAMIIMKRFKNIQDRMLVNKYVVFNKNLNLKDHWKVLVAYILFLQSMGPLFFNTE